ncbi:MAG: 4-hydroxyphenylpyruvate dioxygenase [Ectothiorhodospiraceae bacterium]|nr:4-hydroxyphenylpyruvate dioxygenase [Ectothiorhodospiraceae bacterium]
MNNHYDNPMGTDGFEFIEYTAENTHLLSELFTNMGFTLSAHHRSKNVELFQQGDTNFIINHEPNSYAKSYARVHGPSVCAFGIRVKNANVAFDHAIKCGAMPVQTPTGPMELNIPAIRGVGGSLLYMIDRYGEDNIYDIDFPRVSQSDNPLINPDESGIKNIDHITHNVHRGRMDEWAYFYKILFNFREIRYFDIKGLKTGLKSRAMVSPCGKIRIPINESTDDKSQIEEYLTAYNGEGIQHIAMVTDDIYKTVEKLRENNIQFLSVPDSYYEMIEQRLPGHKEDTLRMKRDRILIDGSVDESENLLLQIFTENVIGPIFFEIIQRKGNEGFGEGNFQALFESIEREQMQRGVL